MMKFKTNSFLFMMLCATALNSWAGYYNTIDINGVSIHLDKDKAGYVNVHDDQLNTDYSCKIENWNDSLISGAGGISLTSDHLGVLLASGNKYLNVKELIDCKGQSIRIHSIHYFNNSISSIIDVNFEKKLVLALVVIDAHFRSYQAIVSKFNGNKNLLSGKGFWSNSSSEPDQNSLFYPGGSIYLGKISVNGEYIAPNDLDCAVDSFPGVWDMARKMKIIFPRDKDDAVIDSKCRQLFSGEKTLDELGGELINMK
ncbi:TPA: hypothetical protein MB351_005306 [Klebsiella pneumoniae]|uniref:hypothetical protein n=1 Tax=Klebsiella pneumoniae TaxID=573 RepID=UPI00203A851B|nr:hypothetical protein [Klebsiella pneumoniae]USC02687.1 hypothetical protein KU665_07850 [Klebsiella pneumoniae]HBT4851654.1 hypothetical protein [Klebsiella pneumoniae]HBT4862373.1 hypothetical protein [Klebsiella pneumoniae]HBT4878286.1 hypothetical protein [Klebsiella pneumoniae]